MAYLARAERRAAIINAALTIMRNSGFTAVTARSVAEECGGSPGLIHQHFSSVDELVAEAWNTYVAENIQEFTTATEKTDTHPLNEFYANHLDANAQQELGLWADAWAHALRTPKFAHVFANTIDELTTALREADPTMSAAEADRTIFIAMGLAGMHKIAPDTYPHARVAAVAHLDATAPQK
ncbi:TetR/AcrR family transcriptional regulator [Timonella sp. A28]|uniref:TetR/AcrR family transcriptional regulator n=1 Tax=Timonella sp. A28 TaxID=3442640 RepID=UPI003EC14ABC